MGGGGVLRPIIGGLLQLLGIVAITVGCWLIFPWLAFIVGGLLLVLLGVSVDPPIRRGEIAVVPSGTEVVDL